MANFKPEASRPYNLDKMTPLGATELSKVMAGGVGERQRRAARLGQDTLLPGSRACSRDVDLLPINTRLCREVTVDKRKRLNVSDHDSNGRMVPAPETDQNVVFRQQGAPAGNPGHGGGPDYTGKSATMSGRD